MIGFDGYEFKIPECLALQELGSSISIMHDHDYWNHVHNVGFVEFDDTIESNVIYRKLIHGRNLDTLG